MEIPGHRLAAGAMQADQELLALLVSMLATQLDRRYIEDSKIPCRNEGNFSRNFTYGERATGVGNATHQIECATTYVERDFGGSIKISETMYVYEARVGALSMGSMIDIAHHLCGVAFDDGVRRD